MTESEQITRHEREIGELRGKLDALATKEFVREIVQEQTKELNQKFDSKFDIIDSRLKEMSDRQQRFKGIGQALGFGLPFLVSALALAAVFLK
ncbi:MAG: hypothetical protein OXI77_08530 [Chloroflexota bacterium]|nr:hypothetical protein [Chloroflexota bacterium]MDE2910724.1 hypothetical protein [Chloroflexota bacterium]